MTDPHTEEPQRPARVEAPQQIEGDQSHPIGRADRLGERPRAGRQESHHGPPLREPDLVETWDQKGHFANAAESAQRFREFLETHSLGSEGTVAKLAEMIMLSEAFARAGRRSEALVACEWLERLFGAVRSAADRERIAEGLVSIGSELLDRGLRVDAIEVLTATALLLRDADRRPLVQSLAVAVSERGFALKQEAWASRDEALMEEAVTTYAALEHEFGDTGGEPFEGLVAWGAYNRAGALAALGRVDEATSCFAQVADRYGAAAEAPLREIAMFAAIRKRMMLAVPEVPPYVTVPLPEMEQYSAVKGVTQLEQVAWFTEDDPEKKQAMIEARVSAALESHRQAQTILFQHRVMAMPFALLLRAFDPEGFMTVTGRDWSNETGLEPHVFSVVSAESGNLEQQLAQAIGSRASVLAIANRSSLLETASLVPRLFLPDEGWEEIAEALIRTAHIIVVGVEAMTPGLRWELECIRRNGRTSSTVVVLGADDDDWRAIRELIRDVAAVDSPAAAATPKAPELRWLRAHRRCSRCFRR